MDGWRKTEDKIVKSQSRVISECYVQASRLGLDKGLCRHHSAQVEGVEGPMGKVSQVVARKGGMPAPHTCLQHLVDSEVLLEKKRQCNTTSLPSLRGRNRLFHTGELVGTIVFQSQKETVVFNISFLLRPAVTNIRSQRGKCAAVWSR